MPYADFCSAVRLPLSRLSRRSDTEQISWGKLSHLPCTAAESTLRTLMDMDFAVRCPLVRYGRLLFGFCPSTRTFVPCFPLNGAEHGGLGIDVAAEFASQIGNRGAPRDDLTFNLGEPDLVLIEPARVSGREVKPDSRMLFEELADRLSFVRGEIVEDDVNLLPRRAQGTTSCRKKPSPRSSGRGPVAV